MEEVLARKTAAIWLDELIETQKRRKEIAVLGKKVEAIVFADSLSIYSGIECLAEALGEKAYRIGKTVEGEGVKLLGIDK